MKNCLNKIPTEVSQQLGEIKVNVDKIEQQLAKTDKYSNKIDN